MLKLVQNNDPKSRAVLFFQELHKTQKVYFLRGEGHPIVGDSQFFADEEDVPSTAIPFWTKSFLPFAQKWSPQAKPEEVSLEELQDTWLPQIDDNAMVLGLNWDDEGAGYECTAAEILMYLEMAENEEEIELPD